MFRFSLFLSLCLLSLSFASIPTSYQSWRLVETHNQYRAQTVPPASNMKALFYDNALGTTANNWASQCIYGHSGTPNVGENIYATSERTPILSNFNVDQVTDAWASEWTYYDWETNTCQAGQICGHYTQIIWNSTSFIGCAIQDCPMMHHSDVTLTMLHTLNATLLMLQNAFPGTFVVCQYSPPGNWQGVKPFTGGSLFNNWQQIGSNMNLVSAKGSEVWALDINGNIYQRVNNAWQLKTGGPFTTLGASPDGWSWASTSSGLLQRWNPSLNIWQTISFPGGVTIVTQVDCMSQTVAIILDQLGRVWYYTSGAWYSLGSGSNNKWVSLGFGNDPWSIRSDGILYHWVRSLNPMDRTQTSVNQWYPVSGSTLLKIHATDLQNIVAVDSLNLVYQLKYSYLIRISTPGATKSAAMTNSKLYIVTTDNKLWSNV